MEVPLYICLLWIITLTSGFSLRNSENQTDPSPKKSLISDDILEESTPTPFSTGPPPSTRPDLQNRPDPVPRLVPVAAAGLALMVGVLVTLTVAFLFLRCRGGEVPYQRQAPDTGIEQYI